MRIVEVGLEVRWVEWLDSSCGSRWTPLDEIAKEDLERCYSIGYVITDTDDHVTLLQSLSPREDDPDYEQQGNNFIVIPKFAIAKSVTLREAKANGA